MAQPDNPLDGRCAEPTDASTPVTRTRWRAARDERTDMWHVRGPHATLPLETDLATIWGSGYLNDGEDLARTMAAAPDMLAALRLAQQFIQNGVELGYIRLPGRGDSALDTLPAILAAIAKAEGR